MFLAIVGALIFVFWVLPLLIASVFYLLAEIFVFVVEDVIEPLIRIARPVLLPMKRLMEMLARCWERAPAWATLSIVFLVMTGLTFAAACS